MVSRGVGGHHRPYKGFTDEWLTPPDLLKKLGRFALDPCSPVVRPWDTADVHYTIEDEGLSKPWYGRVWMNPPYGPKTGKWLHRLADHGWGTALVFARTETEMFFREVWDRADGLLFLRGRLHFHDVHGVRARFNSGAPSVLVAYGVDDATRLSRCGLDGRFVWLR